MTITHWIQNTLASLGQYGLITLTAGKSFFSRPFRLRLMIKQMENIGTNSLFIVSLTGLFTGMVFALQTGRLLNKFNAGGAVGSMVAISLARELAPVLTSLMVTARAGSAMAAQIATMKVSQQIDALSVLAVDPIDYLISPRIIASTLMLPILTAMCDMIGIIGAYMVAVGLLNVNEGIFVNDITWLIDVEDIFQGLFKACVFGFILSTVSCYKGYTASGGAAGVGKSTTQAVVISSISILVVDYFITAILF